MKDVVAASGAPIGSLYHHFPGGKAQIAREALINAGAAYGLLIPTLVDPYDDLGEAVEAVFGQAAADMAETGFANMCPVASVAAEVADTRRGSARRRRGHLHRLARRRHRVLRLPRAAGQRRPRPRPSR